MHKLIEDLNWRYATKKFDPSKKLSTEQINVLKECANLTATSYGLQMLKVIVIENQDIKDALWPHAYNQTQVRDASHVIVIANRTNVLEEDIDSYLKMSQEKRNFTPEETKSYGEYMKSDLLNRSEDQIITWSKNQCYIVLGNLMTCCAQMRIDCCPMEGFKPAEFNKILELENQNLNSAVVLPVGFRSEEDPNQKMAKLRKVTSDFVIDL